ncbi:MAG TPA: UrcA family protein [Steroidobacteraceae bacterium]|nr:UrcA family protein [Steroidobacteraceae bacterium]
MAIAKSAWRVHAVRAAMAAFLLVGVAGVSEAGSPSAPTVTVRYSDLNLGTTQGNEALRARITAAARQVCGESDIRDLVAFPAARTCEQRAIAQALNAVQGAKLASR